MSGRLSAALINGGTVMENVNEFKNAHYGAKVTVALEGGVVLFDPESQKEVVGAEKMTYDEYLDIQIASLGKMRCEFMNLYFNIPLGFKGEIEKKNRDRVCFKRIFTSGMFFDGGMFDGREDHVWMDKTGFEEFQVGDSVEFFAEVYRYVKTGHGKQIDFGLRDPQGISRIAPYELPSDRELMEQSIRMILCESCWLSEQCNGVMCMRPKGEMEQLKHSLLEAMVGEEGA
jgi:hypothetical protein